jgi:hypothetical protein
LKNGFSSTRAILHFTIYRFVSWEEGGLYADDFIFFLLLQVTSQRFPRLSKNGIPVELELALESLAKQVSKSARPVIL